MFCARVDQASVSVLPVLEPYMGILEAQGGFTAAVLGKL